MSSSPSARAILPDSHHDEQLPQLALGGEARVLHLGKRGSAIAGKVRLCVRQRWGIAGGTGIGRERRIGSWEQVRKVHWSIPPQGSIRVRGMTATSLAVNQRMGFAGGSIAASAHLLSRHHRY